MVSPIRNETLRIPMTGVTQGLYVIGASNAHELPIPHLPVLGEWYSEAGRTSLSIDGETYSSEFYRALEHYHQGDIVWVDPKQGLLRTILTKTANANTLLVTEQCDNRCSFCSQPPNSLPDVELYHKATLALLNFNSDEFVGITGGEPTINRSAFTTMLRLLNQAGNQTPLHILTNGRSFSDDEFISAVKDELIAREILWGIPLYGHTGELHDKLVGGVNAFNETVQGLMALSNLSQSIELRIIPLKGNLNTLINLADFIANLLPFVTMVSIMNLEPKGWARRNYDELYVPSAEQGDYLMECVSALRLRGISVNLFNYPLCHLPEEIRRYSCQSISDWKNYYPEECDGCAMKNRCGGFFTSATGKFIESVEPLKWMQ